MPGSPRFEWTKLGTDWKAEGSTVTASGMLAEERYALGSKVVRSGKATFTYTINKVFYPDAHMFLGVAQITDDPEKAATYAFNPPTGNLCAPLQPPSGATSGFVLTPDRPSDPPLLHVPPLRSYVGKQLNEHGSENRKTRLTDEDEGHFCGKQEGCVVECHVDMDAKTLAFSVNGQAPKDCGITLPSEGVRPWIFLYHEGDSVTVEDVC